MGSRGDPHASPHRTGPGDSPHGFLIPAPHHAGSGPVMSPPPSLPPPLVTVPPLAPYDGLSSAHSSLSLRGDGLLRPGLARQDSYAVFLHSTSSRTPTGTVTPAHGAMAGRIHSAIDAGDVPSLTSLCSWTVDDEAPGVALHASGSSSAVLKSFLRTCVNLPLSGVTPLMRALAHPACDALLQVLSTCTCVQPDAVNEAGEAAVHAAARVTTRDAVATLLDCFPTTAVSAVNSAGETALHAAARTGACEALHTLLRAGVDARTASAAYETAWDVAGRTHSGDDVEVDAVVRERVRSCLRAHVPALGTLVLTHEECLLHMPAAGHQESPERIRVIMDRVCTLAAAAGGGGHLAVCGCGHEHGHTCSHGVTASFPVINVQHVDGPAVLRAHSKLYWSLLQKLDRFVKRHNAPEPFTPHVQRVMKRSSGVKRAEQSDTTFSVDTLGAARRAAGAVIAAVDAVCTGASRHAFVAVRPPGHHAGVHGLISDAHCSESCGFCILNSVAIAALHARAVHSHVRRVAIIDVDIHHGNGTEEIVRRASSSQDRDGLFFFSAHLHDIERAPPHAAVSAPAPAPAAVPAAAAAAAATSSAARPERRSRNTTRWDSDWVGEGEDDRDGQEDVKKTVKKRVSRGGKARPTPSRPRPEAEPAPSTTHFTPLPAVQVEPQFRVVAAVSSLLSRPSTAPAAATAGRKRPRLASPLGTSSHGGALSGETRVTDALSLASGPAPPFVPPLSMPALAVDAAAPTGVEEDVLEYVRDGGVSVTPRTRVTTTAPAPMEHPFAWAIAAPPVPINATAEARPEVMTHFAATDFMSTASAMSPMHSMNPNPAAAAAMGAAAPAPDPDDDIVYNFYPGSGLESCMPANVWNAPIAPLWREKKDHRAKSGRDPRNASWGRAAFMRCITERLVPSLRAYAPDLILISAGFDGAEGDIGNSKNDGRLTPGMDLRPSDYARMTAHILSVAKVVCPGRVVAVLEGGYGVWKRLPTSPDAAITTKSVSPPDAPAVVSANLIPHMFLREQLAESAMAMINALADNGGDAVSERPPAAAAAASSSGMRSNGVSEASGSAAASSVHREAGVDMETS